MIPERYLVMIGTVSAGPALPSMLELGNKRGTEHEPYKPYFEERGWRHVSVDLNGEDGALALDLRKPLKLGTFDVVTNFGTSEHVDDQEPVWRNIVEAADQAIAAVTPHPGDWPGHGLFYPWPGFYAELANDNGFVVEKMAVDGPPGRRMTFARLVRIDRPGPFVMPQSCWLVPAPPRTRKT